MRRHLRSKALLSTVGVAAAIAAVALPAPASAADTAIIVSEVAPWASGNAPYGADWFELTNTTAGSISISGWRMDDNSNSFASSVALNGVSSLASGQSAIFVEGTAATAAAFSTAWFGASPPSGLAVGWYSGSGVGLSTGGDAVNVFDASGARQTGIAFGVSPAASPFKSFDNAAGAGSTTLPLPVVSLLSEAGVNGAFVSPSQTPTLTEVGSPGTIAGGGGSTTTTTTTLPPGPGFAPWPGGQDVQTADAFVFGGNMSGLDCEGSGSTTPGILWGARNGPGALFRLVFNGTSWVPDASNGWSAGKLVRYPSGTGEPDAEGVTFVGDGSTGGVYISAERNNAANTVSRNSVLRYDVSGAGAELVATHEWNLTADLPPTGANQGLEAITWIDDSFLVANGFRDESTGALYNPANYPNHGSGLFFVALEANGTIYAYALDHTTGGFTRIATIASGFASLMDLQFDRDLNELWAVCDNTCSGRTTVLRLDAATGRFTQVLAFERPTGMPNLNNEGFAIAPAALCSGGLKPVYWADDGETGGHSIRQGTLPCNAVDPPVIPEFPIVLLSTGGALVLLAVLALRRRLPAAT